MNDIPLWAKILMTIVIVGCIVAVIVALNNPHQLVTYDYDDINTSNMSPERIRELEYNISIQERTGIPMVWINDS